MPANRFAARPARRPSAPDTNPAARSDVLPKTGLYDIRRLAGPAGLNRELIGLRDVQREKRKARLRRHARVRKQVHGTAERPRLSVFRSLNHIYAQVIDDEAGSTIISASSLKLTELPAEENAEGGKKKKPLSSKMRRSVATGRAVAERALEKGITLVTFDRGGYLYHGRVAALAEAARKAGLKF